MIGRRCKHGNMLSRAVLIARVAWPVQATYPTTSSRGTIADTALAPASHARTSARRRQPGRPPRQHCPRSSALQTAMVLAGDYSARAIPVPIPNTVVKPLRADGTAWETVWESTSLPANSFESPRCLLASGAFVHPAGWDSRHGTRSRGHGTRATAGRRARVRATGNGRVQSTTGTGTGRGTGTAAFLSLAATATFEGFTCP